VPASMYPFTRVTTSSSASAVVVVSELLEADVTLDAAAVVFAAAVAAVVFAAAAAAVVFADAAAVVVVDAAGAAVVVLEAAAVVPVELLLELEEVGRVMLSKPDTDLQLTEVVMSVKLSQAVNFFFFVMKAMIALSFTIKNCLRVLLAPFRTNFCPLLHPLLEVMSAR